MERHRPLGSLSLIGAQVAEGPGARHGWKSFVALLESRVGPCQRAPFRPPARLFSDRRLLILWFPFVTVSAVALSAIRASSVYPCRVSAQCTCRTRSSVGQSLAGREAGRRLADSTGPGPRRSGGVSTSVAVSEEGVSLDT